MGCGSSTTPSGLSEEEVTVGHQGSVQARTCEIEQTKSQPAGASQRSYSLMLSHALSSSLVLSRSPSLSLALILSPSLSLSHPLFSGALHPARSRAIPFHRAVPTIMAQLRQAFLAPTPTCDEASITNITPITCLSAKRCKP